MKHLSTEGFTSLSKDELLMVDGGGLLTDLTGKLVTEVAGVLDVAKDLTAATGSFLKNIIGILV